MPNYYSAAFFLAQRNSLFTTESSQTWPCARVMIEALLGDISSWHRADPAPYVRASAADFLNSLRCELTEAFCPSQGTVWAKQRPGSVCTTMITGAQRGPTRAASSAARGRRTSDCTVMPPGSTPQGPSSWWRKAAGWTTSTAMTGRITERGPR